MTKNQSMFIKAQEKPTQTKKLLVGKGGLHKCQIPFILQECSSHRDNNAL